MKTYKYKLLALAATAALQSSLVVPASAQEKLEKAPRKVEQVAITRTLHGKVVDAATGEPLAGIRIQAYNYVRSAAMTDDDGTFTIGLPDFVTSLTYSGEGYNLIQQSIGKTDSELKTVKMYSDKFAEIYSDKTTATLGHTENVTYLNNDMSIDNQIQQAFGGDMLTTMRSGVPGQGIKMLLNGINSLNANAQPLVIVDGVMQNMQYNAYSLHDGFFNNILANIMVEDIEKVSVLKNGTAIYGAKAANGVIIIETKRNKSMATRIDVSVGGSYELLPKLPSVMDAQQYRVYASELIGTTGSKSNSYKFLQTDPNYYYYNMYHNNTDWSKYVYDEAFTQNYSINVQGGDEVANYNLSVGYTGGDATLVDNSYSRFNLRLNTDIVILPQLSVRFDASYSDVSRNLRDDAVKDNITDGLVSAPAFLSMIKSPFLSPYAYDTKGNLSSYLSQADDYLNDVSIANIRYNTQLANPVSLLDNAEGLNKNRFGNRLVTLSITPKWTISKDWYLANHFAFQIDNTEDRYYIPVNGVPEYRVEGLGYVENKSAAMAGRQITVFNDLYAGYSHRFGAHFIDARAGFRYFNDTYRLNAEIGYDSGNDKTPNMGSGLSYKSTEGDDDRNTNVTYYLSGNYNFKERYYLSVAAALDGSSRFGKDVDAGIRFGNYAFGVFPSVEGAWVVSNEDWFRTCKGVDYLRLNVGFDILGNDDIDSQASRTYFVAKRMFNEVSGTYIGNIGNTKLQWETTRRLTTGIQIAGLDNRVNFSVNYFKSTTDNLLSINPLSYITGLASNWNNNGKLSNEGFNVALEGKLVNTKDFIWSLGASVGHYKNKIKALASSTGYMETDMYGATIRTEVGKAANMFYGYRTNGVFSTQTEATASGLYQLKQNGDKQYFSAGDMRFVNTVADNGEINKDDRQIIGDPNPDIFGTIHTKLSWKAFTLTANFNYSLGNDIYNYQRSVLESGSYFYNQTTALLNRWTYEGQHTDVPRASFLDEMGNSRFSDRWIEDGSYLKLKNVTVSYKVPVHNEYIQGITVWAAGNNLFTLTRYLGSDPEFACSNGIIGMGIDRGMLGAGRSFSLGVKINL